MQKSLKDLIYFDIEKAKSLLSQLNGGLINEISRAIEDETEDNAKLGFDLKIVKGNLGEKSKEKAVTTEKISLYHEILNSIETELTNNKILTDLNENFNSGGLSFNDFMKLLPNLSYIKSTGWAGFEDFERFKRILSNFNDIQRLIYESQLMDNPEIKALQDQLANAKKIANENSNRNAKAKDLSKIKSIEKKIDQALKEETEIHLFDDSWVEKVKNFLDTFSPNRLNFRLLPLDDFGEFQILSNLKDKYMLDGSFENTIYTYGSKPNIKLTIIGIITSCPQQKDDRVNHSDEFLTYDISEMSEESQFEKAFRNVFDSFEAFEKFFFVPNYPKIAVSPIAIYREIKYENNSIDKD